MNDDTLIENLNALLNATAPTDAAASADPFSGTVLVAHHKQVLLTAAYGSSSCARDTQSGADLHRHRSDVASADHGACFHCS